MKTRLIHRVWLCIALVVSLPIALQAQVPEERPVARIGFIADEPDAWSEQLRLLIQQELLDLAQNDFDVQFPEAYNIVADGTAEGVAQAVQGMLGDEQIDIAITLGLLGSQIAGSQAPWPRPVLATVVLDAELQGLPLDQGTSGTTNLSYITVPAPVIRDLQTFREITPFTTVDFLLDEETLSGFERFFQRLQDEATGIGITARAVGVGVTAESGLRNIPPDAEAIYLVPLSRMEAGEFEELIQGINARGLPTFAFDGADVARGALASFSRGDQPRLARRVALHAHRILLGDDPSTFSVNFTPGEELVMNVRTIREIEIVPPLGLLLEARRLFEEPVGLERQVTLQQAMDEAVRNNLSLAVEDQTVAAGAEEIRLARANLLPTVDLGATGSTIAKSLAEAANGQNPQYNLDGSLTLQQVLFSENARANVSIQKALQAARLQDRQTAELDVALDAAEAYLNVLRAKTLEQVQQDNLELTRQSMRLAQVREQIGAAGPGERLRLQSELAQRRADRVDAFAQRYAAEVALNQVLNRPLAEEFMTPEADLEGRALIESDLTTEFLTDFKTVALVGDFLVQEALRLSPEIQGLDAAIAAQERQLLATRRAFYLPVVALQGEVSTNVFNGGAGSDLPPIAPDVTDYPWNVGVSVSLPLFEGTARGARREQAVADLAGLRVQRDLAAQLIEQNVRTQLRFAQASLAVIDQSEAAADAARRSLELVTDSYSQGVIGVVDLLEAQTAALVTERGVADAIYDYLINQKRVERAVGKFILLSSPDEQASFLDRLNQSLQDNR